MSLMPLLRLLNWIWMHPKNKLLDHNPVIMIVSGYTISRKSSTETPDHSEWVTTSLWENPRCSSPKYSVPDLSNFIVIWYIIVVLWFYMYTVFTGVSSDDPGYDSSLVMISAHTCTGQRCLPFLHRFTVDFLTPFLCVLNVGDNLSVRFWQPLMCSRLRCFL